MGPAVRWWGKLWTHKHQNVFSAPHARLPVCPQAGGATGTERRPCVLGGGVGCQGPGPAHLMKVVFPVEYWPTSRTMGLLSKSASSRAGE